MYLLSLVWLIVTINFRTRPCYLFGSGAISACSDFTLNCRKAVCGKWGCSLFEVKGARGSQETELSCCDHLYSQDKVVLDRREATLPRTSQNLLSILESARVVLTSSCSLFLNSQLTTLAVFPARGWCSLFSSKLPCISSIPTEC